MYYVLLHKTETVSIRQRKNALLKTKTTTTYYFTKLRLRVRQRKNAILKTKTATMYYFTKLRDSRGKMS